MARSTSTNYTTPSFTKATVDADPFDANDVQQLAAAVDGHDHTTGKGAVLVAGSIPAGSITSGMIADGTIVAGDIADGAVTSAKILDGTIQAADHADASVTNAKLASDTARANLLTNGGFEVWQRGNGPFATSAANMWTADGWKVDGAAGDTISISRDTANMDGVGACAAVTFTKASGATHLRAQHTAKEAADLIGRAVSFSVRVRTATASAVRLGVYSGTAWVYSSYHTGNGVYQTLTVTGVTLTPAGAFTGQTSVWFDASCTAYIDNAMLVTGSVPADYAPLHPADDLARCQRYYEGVGGSNYYPMISGYNAAGTVIYGSIDFKVTKAATPTVTKVGTWTINNAAQPTFTGSTYDGAVMQTLVTATGSGFVGPQSGPFAVTIEANP